MSFTDVFGGSAIYPSDTTYIPLNIAASVELSWPIEQQIGGDNIVAAIIDLTATNPGLAVTLPDARNATQGFTTLFNNVGAENVTIKNNAGGTIATVAPGTAWQLYLTDNSTLAGVWRSFQYGASVSVVNAAALVGNGLINIGITLSLNLAVTTQTATPFSFDANSRARIFNWTSGVGACSLPSAGSLGNGWFVMLRNSGSGDITITPSACTIDTGATKVLSPGDSLIIISDGTNYITLISAGGSGGGSDFNLLAVNVAGGGDYTISGVQLNQVGYRLTGVLSANRNFIVPATVTQYWIDNQTTGAFSLTVKTAAGTGIIVPQGQRLILYCDGTNVVNAATQASITLPLAITDGGTGAVSAGAARTALGVPPTSRTIAPGAGMSGGGDLSADRMLALDATSIANLALGSTSVQPARTITAGNGLTGGGNLSADRTISVLAERVTGGLVNGKVLAVSAGFTVNTSDLAAGLIFGVYNDSGSAITITQGAGVTLRLSGTTTTGSRTLVPRGFAIIWANSGTEAIINGDVG